MFGASKPAFGQGANVFGGFNTAANAAPFGQSAFGKPATSGFGTTFGAPAAQGGGLFGQPATQPSTGLFQSTAGGFGPAQPVQSGFGFGQNTSGGLFGNTQAGSSLFGQSNPAVQPFGAKPQGFGFGATSTAPVGGLFGSPSPAGGGLFGQPATAQPGSSGLFGANTSFGVNAAAQSGTCIKYAPVSGTDVMVKNGHTQNINTLHHCITCMKEYETKSLEELRLEDYAANRKGGGTATMMGGGGFGQQAAQPGQAGGLFNQQDKPLFGQTTTAFGQPSTSTAGGLFGKPATTGFGAQPAAGTGFSFGANTANQSTPLFGATKPFSTPGVGLFGAPATQAQPTPFSTQPSSGFGAFGAPQQTGGLFGAKPADTPAFGMPQTTQAGGFGVFGAPAGAQNTGGLFGAKPTATPFGTAAPAFGAPNTGFGAPQANQSGGMFGNTAFGAKPATTGAPAFGGFNPTPTTNTALGGLNMSGGGMFGNKPAGGGLFGNVAATQPAGGLFGGSGGGLQLGSNLGSNLGGGNTGFGGGLGSFGLGTGGQGGVLGMGGGLNPSGDQSGMFGSLGMSGSNNAAGTSVHQQMIALTSEPFGHSALLKGLVPSPGKADEQLKPTNPVAHKAVLESDKFKVSPGVARLRVKPITANTPMSKKSLFDGLEENDPSVQETLSLKRNVKRLTLRPKQSAPRQHDADDEIHTSNNNGRNSPDRVAYHHNDDTNYDDYRPDDSVDLTRDDTGKSALEDHTRVEVSAREEFRRDLSPGIIQKRVGLSDPRGSTLKSPLQSSSGANTTDDSDRRASWLTTKPLNKWPGSPLDSAAGPSAPLDSTVDQLLPRSRGGLYPDLSRSGLVGADLDCIEDESQEERDKENHSPHPTGIRLNRPGYYTIPSMDELIKHMRADGTCMVPQFTVGRRGYGNVFFDCEMDVAGLDIDDIVHIMNKEIVVYPEDDNKPEIGQGLNRKAQVTLDKVWPKDKTLRIPITDPERLATMDYEAKLRRACDKIGTKFIEYRPQTGSWVFKVQHFSKYGLTESDEDEDEQGANSADGGRQIAKKAADGKPGAVIGQKGAVVAANRGLGGILIPGGLPPVGLGGRLAQQQMLDLDDQTMDGEDVSFSKRIHGNSKGLAMDTSEENSVETLVLYPDGNQSSIFGSKDILSPSSRMQMDMRGSHTLQLMKASFYNMDNDMDDMQSVTDQLVPQGISIAGSSAPARTITPSLMDDTIVPGAGVDAFQSGVEMKPPIIKPQTVMLRYHKRVLPYKRTIAGRLGSACYSDLSIANARLFRVGWGLGSQLTALATMDAVTDAPLAGDLSDLSNYVEGRGADDTSGAVTQRLRIAGGGPPTDMGISFKDSVERHLEITLAHSRMQSAADAVCPQFVPDPERHILAAEEHLREDRRLCGRTGNDGNGLGVSPRYWKQVWSLCLALWGEHWDSDVDPNEPCGARLLADSAAFSDWLEECNAEEEVMRECAEERESVDAIIALLAGNRLRDACKLAQKEKNYFLASILTQIKGDSNIRSLAYNQCASFLETNAAAHVSPSFMSALCLLSGRARLDLVDGSSLHTCRGLTWAGALAVHYWYICDPVATVADALKSFEASFWDDSRVSPAGGDIVRQADAEDGGDTERDIRTASEKDEQVSRVALPVPRHLKDEVRIEETKKRILDLRYQLMCLRASKWYSLDSILNPDSHTPDPLDYRLSWLLQQFLEALGFSHWSANGLAAVTTGFAAQLESHGLWQWAVFVLQHIKDDRIRAHSVKEMILRHAGGSENTAARQLLERLGVPEQWIHLAEAQKAKYMNDPENEARHLTSAEQWTDAHAVILERLAPTYVLNESGDSLRKMLAPLVRPGEMGLIPNWNSGGHLYLEFLDIWEEVKSLVGLEWKEFSYRCESLKPRIAAACTAIASLPASTLKHTVARWEVAARLAQVGCAVVGHPDTGRVARASLAPLLNIIATLDLPPDYTKLQLDKLIDSFTESEVAC